MRYNAPTATTPREDSMQLTSFPKHYAKFAAVALAALLPIFLIGCFGDSDDSVPELGLKAACGSGDTPETGLQGQTTLAERMGGTAAKGINCNLRLIGQFKGEGAYHAQTWID